MPIISPIEAKSVRGRLTLGLIIALLALGGVTMVYPFAIMVSGALRSEMDEADLDLVPRYLVDRDTLYRKFLETKYNQDVEALNASHRAANFSFRDAAIPDRFVPAAAEDAARFMAGGDLPAHWQVVGGIYGIRTDPDRIRELRDRLSARYGGDLEAFGRETGAPTKRWSEIVIRPPEWLSPRFDYPAGPLYEEYFRLHAEAPAAERSLVGLSGHFLQVMIYPSYGQSTTDAYNGAHAVPLASYADFSLPRTMPTDDPTLRDEWVQYAREEVNASFVVLDGVAPEAYAAFLRRRHRTIDDLNRAWNTTYPALESIPLPTGEWLAGARREDYQAFLATQDAATYRLVGPEFAWADWLTKTYGTVERVNARYGTDHASLDRVRIPVDQLERRWVDDHAGSLRWSMATRNFRMVFRELFTQGRVFRNTVVFCALAVVTALIVNPLAAYALSRFQLPGTFKFLLVMIVTMAFPSMVTLIPTFIMLRELNLLNTFAALILPGMASGYSIFLLKGFFDSLPREIYEAATIDGAGEVRIFFQITLALSKPILAVVALGAFNAAYLTFLYALVVCPSQDMWVMSVWLYQYQNNVTTSAVFASVLVASIPTLLVFVLAQNVIMRGIVVPTEK